MKRSIGGLFLLAGGFFLFWFGVIASHGVADTVPASLKLPFQGVGYEWPKDAILFCSAMTCLLLGLGLMMTGGESPVPAHGKAPPKKGGFISSLLFLNSMLMASVIFVAAIGARAAQPPSTTIIGSLMAIAMVQGAIGLLLLILSLLEKPKGILTLLFGFLFWAGSLVFGILSMVQGG